MMEKYCGNCVQVLTGDEYLILLCPKHAMTDEIIDEAKKFIQAIKDNNYKRAHTRMLYLEVAISEAEKP